ncbi:MAG: DUF4159 domain-containing protein [bacterium]|jgi:hypothetical protein
MRLPNGFELPFMRVKPFNGLMIDEGVWQTDQCYHRDHERLHSLMLHGAGVVQGCEVTQREPNSRAVRVYPGVAIDPEGNVIVIEGEIDLGIQENLEGLFYVVALYQDADIENRFSQLHGGKEFPTRIREGKLVYALLTLPPKPYVELARVQISGPGADVKVTNAKDALRPKPNEIDLRFRVNADPLSKGTIGLWLYSADGKEPAVFEGVRNWVREIEMTSGLRVKFLGLGTEVPEEASLVYVNASEAVKWEAASLKALIKRGGVVFADGAGEAFTKAADALATELGEKLGDVKRGHDLLKTRHLFSDAPEGAAKASVKAGNGLVVSSGDYGTAWQGGSKEKGLSREVIRAALEFGVNVAVYAYTRVNQVI